MIQSYKELKVYEKSYQLVIEIYRNVSEYPKEELYGLVSQMKRAAASIPLNIAEGYGKRESIQEFKRFLMMAIGSCDEIRVLLELSRDLGFMERTLSEALTERYDEVGKMLHGLHGKWQ